MASLTGQEMIDEVLWNHGDRDDLTTTAVLRYLNFAQARLARLFDFDELTTVSIGDSSTDPRAVSGTQSYTISTILSATNVDRIIELRRISNGAKIDNLLPRTQDDRPTPQQETWPVKAFDGYIETGDTLYILQTPDQDDGLFVRWKQKPTDLTVSTTSDLDSRDDIIIALATAWVAMSVANVALHDEWIGKAQQLMQTDLAQVPIAENTLQLELAKQGVRSG